jgi:hypothetical protein
VTATAAPAAAAATATAAAAAAATATAAAAAAATATAATATGSAVGRASRNECADEQHDRDASHVRCLFLGELGEAGPVAQL